MAPAVPHRLTWAVARLDPQPGQHLLEAGCGAGVAAALVAERIGDGHLLALDRSATALERAGRRLADHIAAGRVSLRHGALADLDVADGSLDGALAVNVNLFWTGPATAEATLLARALRPGAPVHLVYDRDVGTAAAVALASAGLATEVVRDEGLLAVTGRRPA